MKRLEKELKERSRRGKPIAPLAVLSLLAIISLVNPGQCRSREKFAPISQTVPVTAIKLGDFARPEAGLKLLNGIFSRLSQPQLAQKNDGRQLLAENKMSMRQIALAAGNSQQRGQFGNTLNAARDTSTDPALAIRPQSARRLTVGRTTIDRVIPIEGISIAIPPAKIASKKAAFQQIAAAPAPAGAQFVPAPAAFPAAPSSFGSGAPSSRLVDSEDEKSSRKNELAQNMPQPVRAPGSQLNGSLGAAYPARSESSPYIQEFSQSTTSSAVNWRGNKQQAEEVGERRRDSAATDSGIIRPAEQPGLFKYVREHLKETPRDIPNQVSRENLRDRAGKGVGADADAGLATADKLTATRAKVARADSERDIALEAKDSNGAPLQIAFLPPNTVHGLNGLPLGASEEEVDRFLKNKGALSKAAVSGWKIWTLSDNKQNPLIQVYMRSSRAEAYRIYSQSYVPAGLGLALSDELSAMKSKFGEPAFILEEPGVRTVTAKNYVYPVSQVSFQLVRTGAGSAPQILSLMLFRYL